MKQAFFIGLLLIGMVACKPEEEASPVASPTPTPSITDNSTKEEDEQTLADLYQELENLSGSEGCTNPADWAFTPTGSRACGGPNGYLAYPLSIDVADFLQKVENYAQAEEDYNIKWDIHSICEEHPIPVAIVCDDGSAVLVY